MQVNVRYVNSYQKYVLRMILMILARPARSCFLVPLALQPVKSSVTLFGRFQPIIDVFSFALWKQIRTSSFDHGGCVPFSNFYLMVPTVAK